MCISPFSSLCDSDKPCFVLSLCWTFGQPQLFGRQHVLIHLQIPSLKQAPFQACQLQRTTSWGLLINPSIYSTFEFLCFWTSKRHGHTTSACLLSRKDPTHYLCPISWDRGMGREGGLVAHNALRQLRNPCERLNVRRAMRRQQQHRASVRPSVST